VKAPVKAAWKAAVKPVAAPSRSLPPAGRRAEEGSDQRKASRPNEFVVYPRTALARILAIEEQEIAGARLELFVINS